MRQLDRTDAIFQWLGTELSPHHFGLAELSVICALRLDGLPQDVPDRARRGAGTAPRGVGGSSVARRDPPARVAPGIHHVHHVAGEASETGLAGTARASPPAAPRWNRAFTGAA